MDSVARSFDLDPQKPTPKPLSFPNGTLKKHLPRPPAPADGHHHYRECLRNHAASLGGHAVDGCCEFMPSPSADPAIPTSLTCAACGCHRNFHRRLLLDARLRHDDTDADDDDDDDDDDEESSEDDDGERRIRRRRRRSSGSPPPYSSAPHMLLALSGVGAGTGSGGPGSTQTMVTPITMSSGGFHVVAPPLAAAGPMPRKRFRTKFSVEQKGRMQEMSERLGWRMQKKDEAVVEEFCRQIGIERGVFKVWMHNNKHTYHGSSSSRRSEMGGGGGGGGGGEVNGLSSGAGCAGGDGEGNGLGSGGGNRGGNNYAANGSPPSS